MSLAPGTRTVLLAALVATASGLVVAGGLARVSQRRLAAPDAWAALEQHEADRAATLFAREIEQHPNDAVLHFGAGAAAYALGRRSAALASLKTAVALDPQFAEAHSLLATVAYQAGETDLALRSVEKAAALRPRDGQLADVLERWRHESSVHNSYAERPAGHFRILYEGGRQAQIGDRLAEVLEQEYARIGRLLNCYPAETLTVILYTNQEFQDITRSPSWASGGYDGRIRIAVGGTLASPRELDRVATHELVHAFIAAAAARPIPTWLNEGLATYFESNDRSWPDTAIRRADRVVPLDALANGFNGFDQESAVVAYAESAIAADILASKLGQNIGPFVTAVGSGNTIDQALLTFQVQPNAFHAEWRRRVGLQ